MTGTFEGEKFFVDTPEGLRVTQAHSYPNPCPNPRPRPRPNPNPSPNPSLNPNPSSNPNPNLDPNQATQLTGTLVCIALCDVLLAVDPIQTLTPTT